MSKFKCIFCRGDAHREISDTLEFEIDNKKLIVNNIPAIQCDNCNEKFYDKAANHYIDQQIKIFKSEGFENRAKDLIKEKGFTQEDIGNLLGGMSKQRVNQILNDESIDIKLAYKISNIINEPLENVFRFRKIVQVDDKFYLDN